MKELKEGLMKTMDAMKNVGFKERLAFMKGVVNGLDEIIENEQELKNKFDEIADLVLEENNIVYSYDQLVDIIIDCLDIEDLKQDQLLAEEIYYSLDKYVIVFEENKHYAAEVLLELIDEKIN